MFLRFCTSVNQVFNNIFFSFSQNDVETRVYLRLRSYAPVICSDLDKQYFVVIVLMFIRFILLIIFIM